MWVLGLSHRVTTKTHLMPFERIDFERYFMKYYKLVIKITICVLVMFVTTGCADTSPAAITNVGSCEPVIPEVVEIVQEMIDTKKLSGAVTAVSHKGKIIHFKAQGLRDIKENKPMEKDTIFRIYSMTKSITTVAAMMLWEEGKFKLDDPVHKYIPEFKDLKVYQPTEEELKKDESEKKSGAGDPRDMTIRDLMRHTSGLTYGEGTSRVEKMYGKKKVLDHNQSLSAMIDKLSEIPLLFDPGTKWNYGVSTDVLGYLVERVSGKPLDVFFKERIFSPLKMNDTAFYVRADKQRRFAVTYGPDDKGGLKVVDGNKDSRFLKNPAMLSGGGGLTSTALDYMRFGQMLANKGTLDGQRMLKNETIELMTKNHLQEGDHAWDEGMGFGLGFSVLVREDGDPVAGEYGWGGMASTHFWVLPQEELFVVAMSQILPYSGRLEEAIKKPIYNYIKR